MLFKSILKSIIPDAVIDRLIFLKAGTGVSPYFNYNDKFKTVFIHIPKTAGTSVYTSLFGHVKRNHIRLLYFEAYDKNKYDDYFKFAFVRNPYDRLVSSFIYIKGRNDLYTPVIAKYETFDDFVEALLDDANRVKIFRVPHFNTQYYFLKDRSGKVGVDFLGRFESLEHDFKVVCNKLGMPARLPHHNKSQHKHFMDYYSPRLIQIVNQVYREDFENLGYKAL